MWIKHQNGECIAKYDRFEVNSMGGILGYQGPEDFEGAMIGVYKDKDRAKEVLMDIYNDIHLGQSISFVPKE